jgi:hypothetical protein
LALLGLGLIAAGEAKPARTRTAKVVRAKSLLKDILTAFVS